MNVANTPIFMMAFLGLMRRGPAGFGDPRERYSGTGGGAVHDGAWEAPPGLSARWPLVVPWPESEPPDVDPEAIHVFVYTE
jgi:hypothetical protein